jgi:hypothetical protein
VHDETGDSDLAVAVGLQRSGRIQHAELVDAGANAVGDVRIPPSTFHRN